ncbi:MAG: 3-phenylpropionate MFS transporter [Rhodospirillales bacterium]|nr:3-phenylpropionate MFS transporter [Rhodospirillales bacterium]
MNASQTGISIRLALFYTASFGVVGITLPFWPVWLGSKGLDASEIGIVLALTISGKTIIAPAVARYADHRGERRRPMIALAALAVLAFSAFWPTNGFWQVFIVSMVFATAWTGIMPLGENLTMLTVHARGLDYGRIRLWGSLAFVVAAVSGGWLLEGRSASIIFILILAGVSLTFLSCLILPDTRPPTSGAIAHRPFRSLLSNRTFLLFLGAVSLVQASHSVYYAFGTIHWRASGHADDVIGWLWAEGVIAEIILFAIGAGLLRKIGPASAIILAAIAGMVRWGVTASTVQLEPLIAVQALHALTFGAAHMAAMSFIIRAAAPEVSATAQALYAAAAYGIGTGLTMLAAGHLYEAFAGGAYWAMAAMSAMGLVLAFLFGKRWNGGRIGAEPSCQP